MFVFFWHQTELREPSKCVFTESHIAEKEEISAGESLGTSSRTYNEFLTPEVYKVRLEAVDESK